MSPMNPWWDIFALLHQTSLISNLYRKYMWSSEDMLFSMELLAFLGFLEVIADFVARVLLSEVSEIQISKTAQTPKFWGRMRGQPGAVSWVFKDSSFDHHRKYLFLYTIVSGISKPGLMPPAGPFSCGLRTWTQQCLQKALQKAVQAHDHHGQGWAASGLWSVDREPGIHYTAL